MDGQTTDNEPQKAKCLFGFTVYIPLPFLKVTWERKRQNQFLKSELFICFKTCRAGSWRFYLSNMYYYLIYDARPYGTQ